MKILSKNQARKAPNLNVKDKTFITSLLAKNWSTRLIASVFWYPHLEVVNLKQPSKENRPRPAT